MTTKMTDLITPDEVRSIDVAPPFISKHQSNEVARLCWDYLALYKRVKEQAAILEDSTHD